MAKRIQLFKRFYPAFFFIFGAVLLYFSFRNEDLSGIQTQFEQLKGAWLILLLPSLFSRVFVASSQYYVIRARGLKGLGFGRVFSSIVSATAIHDVMPFVKVGGEVYKASHYGAFFGFKSAVQVVALFGVAYLLGHLVLVWIGLGITFWKIYPKVIPLPIFFVGFVLGFWLVFKLISRLVLTSGRLLRSFVRVGPSLSELLELIRQSPGVLVGATLLYSIGRLLEPVEVYLALAELGQPISLIDAFWLDGISTLINNVLFFFPYSLGIREGAYSFMGQEIGLDASTSLVAATVGRVRMLVWAVVGLPLMLLSGRKPT